MNRRLALIGLLALLLSGCLARPVRTRITFFQVRAMSAETRAEIEREAAAADAAAHDFVFSPSK